MTEIAIELRPDLAAVADMVPTGANVLDLGCGDGALLAHLAQVKQVHGQGVELSQEGVLACVRRGISVWHGNLQEGLADYPEGSFDVVILSQTLQFLDDPTATLDEMLRVGRRTIVSFPNWGYWRCRLSLLFNGRMPAAPDYPGESTAAPRTQPLTIADFEAYCRDSGVQIIERTFLPDRPAPNLLARTAVFSLSREKDQATQGSLSLPKNRPGHLR